MKLHEFAGAPNPKKVRVYLAEKGIAVDSVPVDIITGQNRQPEFLKKNPMGGQHHICYEVPDIHAAKAWFESLGKRVLGEPRIGAHGTLIIFVHPKDMGGQLTEIMETPPCNH